MISCSWEKCSLHILFSFFPIFNLLPTWGKAPCWMSDSFSLYLEITQFCVSKILTFLKRSLGEMNALSQAYIMKKAFSGAHGV